MRMRKQKINENWVHVWTDSSAWREEQTLSELKKTATMHIQCWIQEKMLIKMLPTTKSIISHNFCMETNKKGLLYSISTFFHFFEILFVDCYVFGSLTFRSRQKKPKCSFVYSYSTEVNPFSQRRILFISLFSEYQYLQRTSVSHVHSLFFFCW